MQKNLNNKLTIKETIQMKIKKQVFIFIIEQRKITKKSSSNSAKKVFTVWLIIKLRNNMNETKNESYPTVCFVYIIVLKNISGNKANQQCHQWQWDCRYAELTKRYCHIDRAFIVNNVVELHFNVPRRFGIHNNNNNNNG